ncbi:UNVERIFIED_CONTAM: hypothetical protein ABIC26_000437 [Paenibacillus sp. PvR008]
MAFVINNLKDNSNVAITDQLGGFTVLEYISDLSCTSVAAAQANYYMSKGNMRRKQLMIEINNSEIMMKAGAMQYTVGSMEMTTGVKGVGGLMRNLVSGAVTGTGAIKPHYKGTGTIMLEPTYSYIWLIDVDNDHIAIEDSLFLACETTLDISVVARSNLSSAALGGEGLFNLSVRGKGVLALQAKDQTWLCRFRRRAGQCVQGNRNRLAGTVINDVYEEEKRSASPLLNAH